jgi:modification methylase
MTENKYLNQILIGDSIEILNNEIPENCVDLVFADPPYNLQLQNELWRPNLTHVDAVDDDWDQFDSFDVYDEFTYTWLQAVRRVMKENATIWVSGTYHNIFRVGAIMQDLGFWILNTVAWFKPNAMPNFNGTRLKNDLEFVIWAQYSENSIKTFHYQMMKQFNDFSEGKQLGSVWKIPVCGGEERLKDEHGNKLHSTQKPEELLKRIILASSSPYDLVLDPFVGSGTTAAVAKRLRRKWIGIEREPIYVDAAQKRILAVQLLEESHPLIAEAIKPKPVRVPFEALLDQGYLKSGQTIYLDKPEFDAIILDDGRIKANGFIGSIHQVGAKLKGSPSCNGWTHWNYIDPDTGRPTPINKLRQKIRKTLQKNVGQMELPL